MSTPNPHWSQTSSRLFNACPRAWVNTYRPTNASLNQDDKLHELKGIEVAGTVDHALVHTMRQAWLQRTRDLFVGKRWTKPFLRTWFLKHLQSTMPKSAEDLPELHLKMSTEESLRQLNLLEETQTLRPIVHRQPRRWAYFERRQHANVDQHTLYAAPDLAVFHQHQWTLIRIQFRSSPKTALSQQLEHLLMVHWAMNQAGFPNEFTSYRIRIIRWSYGRWVEHQVSVSQNLLKQARDLMQLDLQEMKWTWRAADSDPSLALIPLALEQRTCQSCRWREGCPGGDDLVEAKKDQERILRRLNQMDEIKSLRPE